uniref:Uncharacterized protein n=1 Tax=Vespula pensylvanica TaxID=30213 RepID=A0A836V049_VESPE|nr:hypothetical protein H0235_014968 [Vespula pensylvanica]
MFNAHNDVEFSRNTSGNVEMSVDDVVTVVAFCTNALHRPTKNVSKARSDIGSMTDRRWPMGMDHKTYYPPFTAR